MKIKELRQKPKEELQRLLIEKRSKLHELRFALAQKKAKNVKEYSHIRKDIARILTLLRQHEFTRPKTRNTRQERG